MATDSETLAEAVARNRARLFVGRRQEMILFERLLAPEDPSRVLFLHGPGGIGKTSILHAASELARSNGWHAVRLDARSQSAEPGLAVGKLDALLASEPPAADMPRLLLIDTFEEWAPIEGWLQREYLPSLPASTRLVLAGRRPPEVRWRTDPGWPGIFRHAEIPLLPSEDCLEYLERRGVERFKAEQATEAAQGNPLLLALMADALEAPRGEGAAELLPSQDLHSLMMSLVDRIVPVDSRSDERRCLSAASLVRETSRPVLAKMLSVTPRRASELFDWLRSLSFVEGDDDVATLHDTMREALRKATERQDPELRLALLDKACAYYLAAMEVGRGFDDALLIENLFLFQNLLPQQVPTDVEPCYQEPAAPEDRGALRAMIEHFEGREQLRLFDEWWEHCPEAFHAIRNADRDVIGFLLMLRLTDVDPQSLERDPMLARVWQERESLSRPFQAGDKCLFLRAWAHGRQHMGGSAVGLRANVEVLKSLLLDPDIAMFAALTPDQPDWNANSDFFGHRELEGTRNHHGEQPVLIIFHDFSVETTTEWLAASYARLREATMSNAPPTRELTFTAEGVRAVLRNLHRPDRLDDSPLLEAFADVPEPFNALRALIEREARALRDNPKTETLFRVLDRTYLRPSADQRAAAEACHLSWDQYRRRLTEAIKLLTARLEQRRY